MSGNNREVIKRQGKVLKQFDEVSDQMDRVIERSKGNPDIKQMADMERYACTMKQLMQTVNELGKL